MLKTQIATTQKLIEVGGLVSIVTHPDERLSERPDFLDIYDQYLTYIRGCPDIWFTTAGELYKYWTHESLINGGKHSANQDRTATEHAESHWGLPRPQKPARSREAF